MTHPTLIGADEALRARDETIRDLAYLFVVRLGDDGVQWWLDMLRKTPTAYAGAIAAIEEARKRHEAEQPLRDEAIHEVFTRRAS